MLLSSKNLTPITRSATREPDFLPNPYAAFLPSAATSASGEPEVLRKTLSCSFAAGCKTIFDAITLLIGIRFLSKLPDDSWIWL